MSYGKQQVATKNRLNWIQLDVEGEQMQNTNQPPVDASRIARCCLCGHPFPRGESKVFPFCSIRCQQMDLGLWLDEKLGLPVEGQEDREFTGDVSEW